MTGLGKLLKTRILAISCRTTRSSSYSIFPGQDARGPWNEEPLFEYVANPKPEGGFRPRRSTRMTSVRLMGVKPERRARASAPGPPSNDAYTPRSEQSQGRTDASALRRKPPRHRRPPATACSNGCSPVDPSRPQNHRYRARKFTPDRSSSRAAIEAARSVTIGFAPTSKLAPSPSVW